MTKTDSVNFFEAYKRGFLLTQVILLAWFIPYSIVFLLLAVLSTTNSEVQIRAVAVSTILSIVISGFTGRFLIQIKEPASTILMMLPIPMLVGIVLRLYSLIAVCLTCAVVFYVGRAVKASRTS